MGCIAGSSCSSDSASNSDPELETPSRHRSPSTPPWIQDVGEALQSPRSSCSSNRRCENWVEWLQRRAAYQRGESPEPGAGRRDNASDTSDDLSDSQACTAPGGRRSPPMPRMFRAMEAHTRSYATAASSSSENDASDLHTTEGL